MVLWVVIMLNRSGGGSSVDRLFRIVAGDGNEDKKDMVQIVEYGSFSWFGLVTSVLHFVQAVIVWGLIASGTLGDRSGEVSLTRTLVRWTGGYANSTIGANYQIDYIGVLNIQKGVFGFFILSSLFQFIGLYPGLHKKLFPSTPSNLDVYDTAEHAIRLRYMEYSISASVMVVCIAAEAGITDVYTLACMFGLMFATNALGYAVHEMVGGGVDKWSCVIVHACSWLVCILDYFFVVYSYYLVTDDTVQRRPEIRNRMEVVTAIIWVMSIMFIGFGFVQFYDISVRLFRIPNAATGADEKKRDTKYHLRIVALIYDGLSFVAKTLLAWMVMGPVLAKTI